MISKKLELMFNHNRNHFDWVYHNKRPKKNFVWAYETKHYGWHHISKFKLPNGKSCIVDTRMVFYYSDDLIQELADFSIG